MSSRHCYLLWHNLLKLVLLVILFFVRKCVFLVKRDFSPKIPLKLSFCVCFPNALYQDLD